MKAVVVLFLIVGVCILSAIAWSVLGLQVDYSDVEGAVVTCVVSTGTMTCLWLARNRK